MLDMFTIVRYMTHEITHVFKSSDISCCIAIAEAHYPHIPQ